MRARTPIDARPAAPMTSLQRPHRPARSGQARREGQALVECVIGLVAILALLGFLLQLAAFNRARQDTMTESRRQVGRLALGPVEVPGNPDYIAQWDAGPDGSTYSADDAYQRGDRMAFATTYLLPLEAHPNAAALMRTIPHNPLYTLSVAGSPEDAFGLFSRRITADVPLLPVVRQLLYRADAITIESEVWLPNLSSGID